VNMWDRPFLRSRRNMSNPIRRQIILEYSKWCVLSALRSGAPVKSRKALFPIIEAISFDSVLNGERIISESDFNKWHKYECIGAAKKLGSEQLIGWSAKIINIYLKTACYIGRLGRKGLIELIHPPLDGYLSDALKEYKILIPRIKEIRSYDQYKEIIRSVKNLTDSKKILLIEIENEWKQK
jgi:hypothetical protein